MIGKRSTTLAAVVTAVTLVPLAVFGGVGVARALPSASQYEYGPSGGQYGKMTICHRTHSKKNPGVTITISASAWPAHQHHGDVTGPCAPRPTTATTTATTHGKSGEHGNNGHHAKP